MNLNVDLCNMPIGKIEEAQAAALKNLGWLPDIGDILGLPKCKAVCKIVYPPLRVECTIECTLVIMG